MIVAGERLTTSWEAVLRLLEAVPGGNDAITVSLAFQSVHLVAADLMPSLPANLLRSSLEMVSLYAVQQVCCCLSCAHGSCPKLSLYKIFDAGHLAVVQAICSLTQS